MPALRPCLTCGELTRNGSYCRAHGRVGFAARPSPSSRNRPSPALRRRIRERDAHRCRACGAGGSEANPLRVHHLRRVADAGTHEDGNLVTLCDACHRGEHPHGR